MTIPVTGDRTETADVVLKVGRVYAMDPDRRVHKAIAVKRGRVVALAEERDQLDALIGPRTAVVDDRGLCLYPAFHDTHNHQLLASRDIDYVSLEHATSIADVVRALRQRAAVTPPGEWIISSRCWHETHLAEGRLPTARELDEATSEHPVFVARGGHVAVANSRALALAGLTADSPNPSGGTVVRGPDGAPTGVLIEPGAVDPVRRLLPQQTTDQQVSLLARQCELYNSRGIGIVRDPGLFADELGVYERLNSQGRLTTRTRVMFWVMPHATVADTIAYIDALPRLRGDEQLGVWGLKLGMDGGVEGGYLDEPYASDPGFHGHAFWEPKDFEAVVEHAVDSGWRVGCHAVGDAAVRRVVDAFESVASRRPGLAPGTLVIEHAFLADAQTRARAIRAGVGITVQHPLLYSLAGNLLRYWGEERTREVMPVRAWLDDGALIAAGSDCNVSFFDPLLSIWGMLTRGTRTAGIQGAQYRIDRYEALDLYTAAGGRLVGEAPDMGTLSPGSFADLTAFDRDLMHCPVDELPELTPVLTMVGGRAVHDPQGRLTAAGPSR